MFKLKMRTPPSTVLLFLAAVSPTWAAIEGRVVSTDGVPIENTRVDLEGETGETVSRYTDFEGAFSFAEGEPPTVLNFYHPRFLESVVEVTGPDVGTVVLESKQEIFQEIAVSARRGESSFAPSSTSASVIDVAKLEVPAATLTEIVATIPGVSENGQGGIFQTYSIRGVARQRVLTLLSGMRIVGERRAGVSASFVDPKLIGKVDVIRGPASTFYGSGALGGVIQMFPRAFERPTVEIGYDSNGDGSHQLFGFGGDDWSIGVVHRRSGTGETADGMLLNDAFDQTSITLARNWRRRTTDYTLETIASRGSDIGKSNSDFPTRVTVYPEENHLLLRFGARSDNGWRFDAWAHPNDLETRVRRDGRETATDNEALDLGFNWQSRSRWGEQATLRYGVEYVGRKGVEAREVIQPIDGRAGPTIIQTVLDGGEDELGLYGAYEVHWSGTVLTLGGRLSVLRQRQEGVQSQEDTALTGFAGLVVPLKSGFELAANLGSGLRFPSLSERFFSGFTPRGFVSGDPEIEVERSLSSDLALRYFGSRLFLSVGGFRTRVEDYIERIEVADDELQFVNLTAGDLTGFELEGAYRLSDRWGLGFGGHQLEGRDDDGSPLADVPADRLFLRSSWQHGRWSINDRWEHRFEKNDPGSGEMAIGAVDLVSLTLTVDLADGFTLALAARNLLDELYFNSADDKVELARGRSMSLSLGWQG